MVFSCRESWSEAAMRAISRSRSAARGEDAFQTKPIFSVRGSASGICAISGHKSATPRLRNAAAAPDLMNSTTVKICHERQMMVGSTFSLLKKSKTSSLR